MLLNISQSIVSLKVTDVNELHDLIILGNTRMNRVHVHILIE